jgi:hypothetical protein
MGSADTSTSLALVKRSLSAIAAARCAAVVLAPSASADAVASSADAALCAAASRRGLHIANPLES